MSLTIDRLDLTLPKSLQNRRLAITKLLSVELGRFNWPETARIEQLNTPMLEFSSRHTNLIIARSIAKQIHQSTLIQTSQGSVNNA